MGLQMGLNTVTQLSGVIPAAEPSPPLGLILQPLPHGKQVRNLLELETSVLEGSSLLGLYRHCVEKKSFFLSIRSKAKNVRKLLGHSRSPLECDFHHWHLASSLHASSVAAHLNTKVTCEDNTERGGI